MNNLKEVSEAAPILWNWVLGICAMIAALGGAAAVLSKLSKPIKDMQAKITAQDKEIQDLRKEYTDLKDEYERRFKNDLDNISSIKDAQKQLCACMFALMDHAITGNSIEKLKKSKDDLYQFLLEK